MMSRIFFTECRRSLKITLALIVCSFLVGFAGFSTFTVKKYIQSLFAPINWGADLIILPKGANVEDLQRSLLNGKPEGLIPLTLISTLLSQQKNESTPSLQILGFIPYLENGQTKLAVIGNKEKYFTLAGEDSVWNQYPTTSWSEDLTNRENYKTAEWGAGVLMGALAKGDSEAIQKLKELIDRRTVAQAVIVKKGESDTDKRLDKLDHALFALIFLILLCLIPGLTLSVLVLGERRFSISVVMGEIGMGAAAQRQFLFLQILGLVVSPCFLGILLGWILSPTLHNLLKFS